jgi:hypothetical protein
MNTDSILWCIEMSERRCGPKGGKDKDINNFNARKQLKELLDKIEILEKEVHAYEARAEYDHYGPEEI